MLCRTEILFCLDLMSDKEFSEFLKLKEAYKCCKIGD